MTDVTNSITPVPLCPVKTSGKRKRRIVPEDQRKRIAVSCDRCRKRKLRCRALEDAESLPASDAKPLSQLSDADTCSECLKAGVSCTRTLPRKKRVYGSVDTLSVHYQALLHLVKDLFPDQDCETLPGILQVAKKHKISIPENLDPEAIPETAFLGSKSSSQGSISVLPVTEENPKPFSPPQQPPDPAPSYPTEDTPSVDVVKSEVSAERRPLPDLGAERIIYDRVGVPYYVGSSGSMAFFDSLCKIIGKKNEQRSSESPKAVPPIEQPLPNNTTDISADSASGALLTRPDNNGVFFYTISASTFADSAMLSLPDVDQVSFLPPKADCDIYVDAFLSNINPLFPFFRIKRFKEKYEQYWADIRSTPHRKGKWESQIDWRCCLYMVLVMGARSLIVSKATSRKYGALSKYASVVQGALSALTVTTSLETVQALFLLAYYFYGINERNAAWLMTGITCRQAMAMGFHRESACASCPPEDAQQRKQIWYSLYSFELALCANLGRPSCIRHDDIDVSSPDENDEELRLYNAPGTSASNKQLLKYFNDVIVNMHLGEFKDLLTQSNIDYTLNFARKLKDFLGTLPRQLSEISSSLSNEHARSILKIHMRAHYAISILSRPFVLYMAGSDFNQISPQKLEDLILILNIGCASTIAISQILTTLSRRGLVNGVFHTDIFYGYCACLVLSLISVTVSSGKFPHKRLAYTKETINSAIHSIVKVMDSIYLEGTMFRLARVTASILRGLSINLQSEERVKQKVPVKEKSQDLNSYTPSYPSTDSPVIDKSPGSLSIHSINENFPQTLLEEYEKMFLPRESTFTTNSNNGMADFHPPQQPQQQSSDISQMYLEDLDLFTETFNTSFYDVSNTFNFPNILFPPTAPEMNYDETTNTYASGSSSNQHNGTALVLSNDISTGVTPISPAINNASTSAASTGTAAPLNNLPGSSGHNIGSQGYLDALYNHGDVGVISNMSWMKEDHGKSQLMDYVKQKSKQKQ